MHGSRIEISFLKIYFQRGPLCLGMIYFRVRTRSFMRAGAIYRWNPDVWPEMFDEVDEKGSNPGLTWRSRLNDIIPGSFIAILGPKNSEYQGIIAVGEALSTVSVRPGRDLDIVKSLPIEIVREILGEDIEDRVQSGMYLDSIAVEDIQMYTE